MNSELGRAAFHLGFFVAFASGIMLLVLDRGTAEFAISVFTFGIGVIFLLVVVILVKIDQRNSRQ